MRACLFLVVSALVVALPSRAEAVAVLGVDAGGPDPAAAAEALRAHLARGGVEVLAREETAARLGGLGIGNVTPIAEHEAKLASAEEAFAALEGERSLAILEGVIEELASDAELSEAKLALLEGVRVRAASRLMALAGPGEEGEGELGARALAHLVAALGVNPALTLDEREHPPKMRRLLAKAAQHLEEQGRGSLTVGSVPAGATVVVDGRALGQTPLFVDDALPRGRHRAFVELGGARSATRFLDVGAEGARLEVDLAFEGALAPAGAALRPLAGHVVDVELASKVAALLGVGRVLLVGVALDDEGRWLYGASWSARREVPVRRAAVRLAADAPGDNDLALLARHLDGGDAGADVGARHVPSGVFPGVGEAAGPAAAAAGDDDGAVLWWAAGIGGGALVAALVGGGALALAAWSVAGAPPAGEGRFRVEVVP